MEPLSEQRFGLCLRGYQFVLVQQAVGFPQSGGGYRREALRFVGGFAVCYLLQLAVVWLLTRSIGDFEYLILGIVLSGYGIATLLGNVVYTLANFAYNRLVTFRE